MIRRLAFATILLALTAGAVRAADGGSHAWFDAPLAWQPVPVGPVEVLAHVAIPAGAAEVRLDVDGVTVATATPDQAGQSLTTAAFTWTPIASGLYLLEVFGRPESGDWQPPGVLEVTVTGPASSTTTSTTTTTTRPAVTTSTTTTSTTAPATTTTSTTTTSTTTSTTTTTSSTTTTRPTTTTTSCLLGVPAPSGPTGGVSTKTPTLTWSYSACQEPEEFEVQLSRDAGFARIEWSQGAGGELRALQVGPIDCATWYWRIRTYHLGTTGPWSSAGSFVVNAGRSC